ncbi:hypothetical protein N431DRAFT_167624 [Stipitochalara longipes BDJ]|nr:hypothetical protein N431DRAFT_167624 [Stipitochalara longipes BDJ]
MSSYSESLTIMPFWFETRRGTRFIVLVWIGNPQAAILHSMLFMVMTRPASSIFTIPFLSAPLPKLELILHSLCIKRDNNPNGKFDTAINIVLAVSQAARLIVRIWDQLDWKKIPGPRRKKIGLDEFWGTI